MPAPEDAPRSHWTASLNNAAMTLRKLKHYREAETLLLETLRLERPAGDSRELALFQCNLGFLYIERGDPHLAVPPLEESIAVSIRVQGPHSPIAAMGLHNLAAAYQTMNQPDKARVLYEQSLAIKSILGNAGDTAPTTSLVNLATLERDAGNDAKAKLALQGALRHSDEAQSRDIRTTLSTLHERLGNHEMARRLAFESLQHSQECHPADSVEVAAAELGLANALSDSENQGEAERLFRKALATFRRLDERLGIAKCLNNLGLLLSSSGRIEEARTLLKEALTYHEQADDGRHEGVADVLNNIALLDVQCGDHQAAEAAFRQALDLRERTWPQGHPRVAQSRYNVGMCLLDRGAVKDAVPLLESAFRMEDKYVGDMFSSSSEEEQFTYGEQLVEDKLDVLMMYTSTGTPNAPELPRDAELRRLAFEVVIRRKALASETALAARKIILEMGKPDLVKKLRELDEARHEEQASPIVSAAERRALLEAELIAAIPELRLEERLRRADTLAMAASLPAGSALVEFVRFNLKGGGQKLPVYVAFVLPAAAPDRLGLILLGLADELDSAIQNWRLSLLDGSTTRSAAVERAVSTALGAMFDRIHSVTNGCSHLFIAPEGAFVGLPFEALTLTLGNGVFAVEQYCISYLTTGRDLLRLTEARGRPSSALVFGAPDFDLGVRATDSSGVSCRFGHLPSTLREVRWIAERLGVQAVVGADATFERLRSAQSPGVLHIASHAFFDRQDIISDERNSNDRGQSTRSGVALAGANAAFSPDGRIVPHSGVMTAAEMRSLDLRATELVVLSACETGLGAILRAEGVVGLRRAITIAGARALLMSLWSVPDEPTLLLMQELYRRLLRGTPLAEALRGAKLALRRQYPETVAWAGFVCLGDPGPVQCLMGTNRN
ncbi:MAG TPA: CHAT domain-containing protein [Phycisphaerales bacterium]|nr:CHAT domain-containing protein [Phycisphaerales bacterium]